MTAPVQASIGFATPKEVQRQFNFAGVNRGCLAMVSTARRVLWVKTPRVMELILDKQLVAFDLRGEASGNALPGIWFQSLRAFWERQHSGCQAALDYGTEATALAIADLLPEHRDRLRLTELEDLFCVSRFHMHNLVRAGLLQAVNGTGNTVNQTPMIPRRSVVEFLTARRMA